MSGATSALATNFVNGTIKIRIHPQHLNGSVKEHITKQLKKQLEHKWSERLGYVDSVEPLVVPAYGRIDPRSGFVEFTVDYKASTCKPFLGQRLRARIVLVTKLGLHFEAGPLRFFMIEKMLPASYAFVNGTYMCAKTGTVFKHGDEHDVVVVGTSWSDNQWVCACMYVRACFLTICIA
jgi:DNA-directed RNA polymerase subunit E'/Rpb7